MKDELDRNYQAKFFPGLTLRSVGHFPETRCISQMVREPGEPNTRAHPTLASSMVDVFVIRQHRPKRGHVSILPIIGEVNCSNNYDSGPQ